MLMSSSMNKQFLQHKTFLKQPRCWLQKTPPLNISILWWPGHLWGDDFLAIISSFHLIQILLHFVLKTQ
ncbi:hypothetical protein L1887_00990 [Cichorium endivia]|nr:hypothetical protein L1887_00990 [Cichorium endivia]